jgi:uncharacterized protein YukE
MVGHEVSVDTNNLRMDITNLEDALKKAKIQLKDMFTQVEELDEMWDGPANETFRKQFKKDYDDSLAICDTVDDIIECLKYAREQYDLCENGVESLISKINI